MKLYILTTSNTGYFPFYKHAYTDREMAEYSLHNRNMYGDIYEIKEIDLPFAGKYICYVHSYHGYTYGHNDMHDVDAYSDIYPSIDHAKGSQLWTGLMECVASDGEEKYIAGIKKNGEHFVATKVYNEPFFFGDYCLGCFHATIRRIRVVKESYESHRKGLDAWLKEIYGYESEM